MRMLFVMVDLEVQERKRQLELRSGFLLSQKKIDSFFGDYSFLSNFHIAPVTYNGLCYPSSEAAFQAQKCMTDEERKKFCKFSPSEAKYYGRTVNLRPDWEDVKEQIMEDIVRAKFTQNQYLGDWLLDTGDAELIEGNNWGDTTWGVDIRTKKGKNLLGKILMKIRDELKGK